MKLTPSFKLEEFLVSSRYPDLIKNAHVPNHIKWNLFKLARILMQNIRDYIEKPITITSGYRTPELNLKVGGRKASQHEFGEACDFTILHKDGTIDSEALERVLSWVKISLAYAVGECIDYRDSHGTINRIHISLPDPRFYSRFYTKTEK